MSRDQFLIRAAEPDDVGALTDIMNQPRAVWGTLQRPYMSVAERRKRLETPPTGTTQLVAAIDGSVIGTASVHRFDNPRKPARP